LIPSGDVTRITVDVRSITSVRPPQPQAQLVHDALTPAAMATAAKEQPSVHKMDCLKSGWAAKKRSICRD